MSLAEKAQFVRGVMNLCALTVLVFLRHRLGYRLLNPLALMVMTFALFVLASFKRHTPNPQALMLFAVVMCAVGIAKRFKRWIDARRGIRIHSYYIGDSIFECRWFPQFLLHNRRFTRFFDSFVCLGAGIAVFEFSPVLGGWLIFCGFCVRALEAQAYQQQFERDLDTVDGLIMSGVQSETVDRFSEPSETTQQQSANSPGIPTGLSRELKAKIWRRKAR